MGFNIDAPVPMIENFSAESGVEAAVLKWTQNDYPVEIWRNSINDFDTAVLVTTTSEAGYADAGLTVDVLVYHWARHVRTLSTGVKVYGERALASSTPRGPEVGPSSIDTVHIVPNAVTGRATFQSTDWIYCRVGTDENGGTVPPGNDETYEDDIFFMGTGNPMVIECYARIGEVWVIPRFPSQMVARCKVHIGIAEDPDPQQWWSVANTIEDYECPLYVNDYKLRTPETSDLAMFQFSRDYNNTFIIDTVAGTTYRIKFVFTVTTNGNNDNYVILATDLRQVLWSEFKR
jgi:hypothetical protein